MAFLRPELAISLVRVQGEKSDRDTMGKGDRIQHAPSPLDPPSSTISPPYHASLTDYLFQQAAGEPTMWEGML